MEAIIEVNLLLIGFLRPRHCVRFVLVAELLVFVAVFALIILVVTAVEVVAIVVFVLEAIVASLVVLVLIRKAVVLLLLLLVVAVVAVVLNVVVSGSGRVGFVGEFDAAPRQQQWKTIVAALVDDGYAIVGVVVGIVKVADVVAKSVDDWKSVEVEVARSEVIPKKPGEY